MSKKILVFGGAGLVGTTFISENSDNFSFSSPTAKEVDILDPVKLKIRVEETTPDWIVNFAAFTNVEEAEYQDGEEEGLCYQINVTGVERLAQISREKNIPLLQISTEYVFNGEKTDGSYNEDDKPDPINWYGKTKFLGEEKLNESGCDYLLVRISMPYAPNYELKGDIARAFLKLLKSGKEINALTDAKITPTEIFDISNGLRTLLENEARGVFHVCTTTPISPFDFVTKIAEVFGLDRSLIKPTTLEIYNSSKKAAMLKNSSLDCSKFVKEFGGGVLHPVKEGLEYFKSLYISVNH